MKSYIHYGVVVGEISIVTGGIKARIKKFAT